MLTPELTETPLAERVRRLEAIEAARAALARYAAACDAQDIEAIAKLFSADATLAVPGREHHGRDEVVAFYLQAWQADPSAKSHFITNVEASWLGDDRVEVASYFLYTAAGDATSVIGWGEYRDVVSNAGADPVFERKSIAIRRAVDVRDGWAGAGA
jgi:uncharacterized protein (TIGR02246 family)